MEFTFLNLTRQRDHIARFVGMRIAPLCLALYATSAWAWGPEGHALIADMAFIHLTPVARAEVLHLLATDQVQSMDDVSSWADAWRAGHPATAPGHFVDIPLGAPFYDETRDCHYDEKDQRVAQTTCVVTKLADELLILADRSQTDVRREEALKWVIHFVGDIHQPLHAENNFDRGGNDIPLMYFGKATNLHAVWDGGIIEHHYGWQLGPNYSFDHQVVNSAASVLDAQITVDQRRAWSLHADALKTDIVQWANDSHALAASVYLAVPVIKVESWSQTYQDQFWPILTDQLQRASVRLAAVLNKTLGEEVHCPSVPHVAFYAGRYVGPENKLDPEDFARDTFCAHDFLVHYHPKGFVTVFGSSRIVESNHGPDPRLNASNNRIYADVRQFANKWTSAHGAQWPVLTGAGPGLMEAASRGATDAHGPSIGYTTYYGGNQDPAKAFWKYIAADGHSQPIISDGLIFTSVAERESAMITASRAIVVAPGGTGTNWEIFQTIETLKSNELTPVPVFLFGKRSVYWGKFFDYVDDMIRRGVLTKQDVYSRIVVVETVDSLYANVEAALSKP